MTEMPPADNDPQMRISDADRARLADLLDDAYADGRLDQSEHGERMTAALDARTVSDIAPLVGDLAPLETVMPSAGAPAGMALVPTDRASVLPPIIPGTQQDRISTMIGDVNRGAGSILAVHTEISNGLGDVRLDLTQMSMAAHDVEVEIHSFMGDVILMVPEGIRVIDQTSRFLGDSKLHGMPPCPASAPTVTLTGFMALGDVRVYGPEHKSFLKKLRHWFGHD
ncbi:DUF1707 SHOCT-like domain-containing protein [Acidipropionibacterium jensenii]|uniref:DUF1707 domain-containing protein n=1 Tax=Acidipropionibacterium jensenii TaxID=1749 RepID=A0A3T0S1G7_9ACTN|nr:DUF1707 domain-containing protein [Acidipropionibacterium jensenii]MDN6556504.1 DUF1707 domain-containing protein [Acidipropionibacterium acidipropionici]AZZ40173.1 DUF1707 domain-containing protein [Acidipropionibacterium jensenii]MDN5977308.1 DUF1707 domain-containing protein [Acidipropionibacterium jensenii]MDN5997052.1 DUF1707 domain-containing protein [Acidipropionibacterium jensenii]MDN6426432.1 DUF1707 domain-containing protein [Acidipropionibacterium jensenii]